MQVFSCNSGLEILRKTEIACIKQDLRGKKSPKVELWWDLKGVTWEVFFKASKWAEYNRFVIFHHFLGQILGDVSLPEGGPPATKDPPESLTHSDMKDEAWVPVVACRWMMSGHELNLHLCHDISEIVAFDLLQNFP